MLKNLTIVTITFNDKGLVETLKSIEKLLENGAFSIIQNGGEGLSLNLHSSCTLFEEKDSGIYNAINKGIARVKTDFFMLVHAGDTFISEPKDLFEIMYNLESSQKDISINSQLIGSRLHSSKLWRPWMLSWGVQPPHLPCVYRTSVFINKLYREDILTISDFDYFTKVNWNRYSNDSKKIIRMSRGGRTSSGLNSFLHVCTCFIKTYGLLKGAKLVLFRIPFKLLQAIY